jgi:hypothetical protein
MQHYPVPVLIEIRKQVQEYKKKYLKQETNYFVLSTKTGYSLFVLLCGFFVIVENITVIPRCRMPIKKSSPASK